MKNNIFNINIKLFIVITAIFLIIVFYALNLILIKENFSNYLFPIKGLEKECAKSGLEPAYMPTSCFKSNSDNNPYSNCKCVDKDGICKICHNDKNYNGNCYHYNYGFNSLCC